MRCHSICEHLIWPQNVHGPTHVDSCCGLPPRPLSHSATPQGCALGSGHVPSTVLCAAGVQAQPACSSLCITYIYQELTLASTCPGKSSPEISHLKSPCPTVNFQLIQGLDSKVSAYYGSCIQPNLFLDLPQAGAMPESHLLSASSAQLVFLPASEVVAFSKVEQ